MKVFPHTRLVLTIFSITPTFVIASGTAVPIFSAQELIVYLSIFLTFISIQIYCAITIYRNTKLTSYRFLRYLGIYSGPAFWFLLAIREKIYVESFPQLSEFIYRCSFFVLLVLLIAPFICWYKFRSEMKNHSNNRMQSDAAEPRR